MERNKFSIQNKQKLKSKNNSEIDKVYRRTKTSKKYFIQLLIFISILITICLSPVFLGKTYDYKSVELNNQLPISGSLSVKVIDMQYNSKNGLFKIVLNYEDETNTRSLSNLMYSYKINYITNKKDSNEINHIKISDTVDVIYYTNLPKNFEVLSFEISPQYIHPEIETTNDLKDKKIKFYALQKDVKINNSLNVDNQYTLKCDSINYQISKIQDNINIQTENIDKSKTAIEICKKDIDNFKMQLELQTSDEQVETKNNITNKENQIKIKEEEIEKSRLSISDYEIKINKLKQNIN